MKRFSIRLDDNSCKNIERLKLYWHENTMNKALEKTICDYLLVAEENKRLKRIIDGLQAQLEKQIK